MRVGFIGTGNFARQHAEVLKELGMSITACYSTNQEKAAEFSRVFNCRIFPDPNSFISNKFIDALYIVIPPYAHDGKVELTAIDKNIPFLCEKPIGLDLAICNKIMRQIKEKNHITSSGYLLRYEDSFNTVKELISRNHISTIRICSYSYTPAVPWWRQSKLSGGMMVESGTHYVDLLRYLFGEIDCVSALTHEGIAKKNIPNCDIYDSMECILKFNSGKIASIGITHLLNKIQARTDMLEIYGENFALKINLYKLRYKNEALITYKEANNNDWQIISTPTSKKFLLIKESQTFLNAIQNNDCSLIKSSYPDALCTLKTTFAMTHSAQNKTFVYLSKKYP